MLDLDLNDMLQGKREKKHKIYLTDEKNKMKIGRGTRANENSLPDKNSHICFENLHLFLSF